VLPPVVKRSDSEARHKAPNLIKPRVTQLNGRQAWCRLLLGGHSGAPRSKPHQAWRQPSGARHKALYQNLVYGRRLAYDIIWARFDAFCLVPLSLRSAWRRRVAPNLNQKVEKATFKNYSAALVCSMKQITACCIVTLNTAYSYNTSIQ